MSPLLRLLPAFACVLLAIAQVACSTTRAPSFPYEDFGSTTKHSRTFPAPDKQTCEAARRALLSQGYVINTAQAELVNGRKNFQPESELHIEVDFRVVCTPEDKTRERTIVFVTAQQERYALKKSSNAASVGVGVLGSVSLPLASSNDSMVKIGSATISAEPFYERFFLLLERYLATAADDDEAGAEPVASN